MLTCIGPSISTFDLTSCAILQHSHSELHGRVTEEAAKAYVKANSYNFPASTEEDHVNINYVTKSTCSVGYHTVCRARSCSVWFSQPADVISGKGSNSLKPSGHYMYHQFNIQQFYVLPTQCICFVWISEQTAIISLYCINWLFCITETECVYCAVRIAFLFIIHVNINH